MIPKKLYLNYVNDSDFENDVEITWSEKPIDVAGCKMLNREYTDLSQVWNDASEIPDRNHQNIIYQQKYCSRFNINITYLPTCLRSCKITSRSWDEFIKEVNMRRWAYIDALLPKGGEE